MWEISSFGPHPGDPLTISQFGPPPGSKRRRVGRPFLKEGPGQRSSAQNKASLAGASVRDSIPDSSSSCPGSPLKGGRGSLKGRGGFSGTLPPLQGKFVMQSAELPGSLPRTSWQQKGLRARPASLAGAPWLPTKTLLTPWKGVGQLLARWFSPQTGSGTSLAWWRGLPDFPKGPRMANRSLSGLSAPSLPSHRCRGWGSLKGRGASQAPSLPFKANLSCS